VYISPVEFLIPQTNRFLGHNRDVKKVLRWDSKQFGKEIAGARKGSEDDVIKKYKLLVDKRTKVGGHPIHCNPVNSLVL